LEERNLDLMGINDMHEEFASANEVVISINRLAIILRTTEEERRVSSHIGTVSM